MAKDKTYRVNEIFYSLQGEGARAGTANVFVRFSGCNLECKVETHGFDCDTEFVSGRPMTAKELLGEMNLLGGECRNVIFTGGEPMLQLDRDLIMLLKINGWFIAVETNGTKPVPHGVDWITLSPKVAEHAIKILQVDELKYVRSYGQGIPKPRAFAAHKMVSPAFDGSRLDGRTLAWCIKLVKENPEWRLSVQQHKAWRVR